MLVDEELVVSSVDRVVQGGLVEPDLDVADFYQWPVQLDRVADLRSHGVADALFLSSPCDGRNSQDPRAQTSLVLRDASCQQ